MEKKTIGIIGGMGPAATARLFESIISHTTASSDAEHIRIVMDNNPKIPDRTAAILNHSNAPVVPLVNAAQGLASIGADFLVIPCVTSHFFFDQVQEQINVPICNMIDCVAEKCAQLGMTSVGILATTGTCKSRIFDKKMKQHGISVSYPLEDEQKQIMDIIYNQVKAGKKIHTECVLPCLSRMTQDGVECFILGCTELPLAFRQGDYGYTYIDVIEVLAEAAISRAGYLYKENII